MRKLGFLVVTLAGLGVAQTASAVTQVWFQATGNNANSTVQTQGAPGGTLDLLCNATAPGTRCEWTVTMRMNALAQDAGIVGWANNWASSIAGPDFRIKSLTRNTALFPSGQNGAAGAPPALWTGANSSTFDAPVRGLDLTLATFVLSKTKSSTSPDTWAVTTSVGNAAWGCAAFDENGNIDPNGGALCLANNGFPLVAFGANAPVLASAGTPVLLPVITGQNVPEPATLGLIALGLIGLVRRRR